MRDYPTLENLMLVALVLAMLVPGLTWAWMQAAERIHGWAVPRAGGSCSSSFCISGDSMMVYCTSTSWPAAYHAAFLLQLLHGGAYA